MSFADSGAGRTVSTRNGNPIFTTLTLAGTVAKGDLIGYSSGWVRADADTGPIKPNFIALQDGVSGNVISVATEAEVGGFTGATIGNQIYPSGTPGQYSDSQVNSQAAIGKFLSATMAYVRTDPTIA